MFYQVTADSEGVVELEHLIANRLVENKTLINQSTNSYFMCEVAIRTISFTFLSDTKDAAELVARVWIGVDKLKTWKSESESEKQASQAQEEEQQSDLEALEAFRSCKRQKRF